jgi:NADH-quinone oxidoreductase subunit M
MVQRVAYGNAPQPNAQNDLTINEYIGLAIIIGLILFLGVYPKPLLDATSSFAATMIP